MLSFFGNFMIYGDRTFLNSTKFFRSVNMCNTRKKNTMSLQVLCSPLLDRSRTYFSEKRVPLCTSERKYRASMTVEAALVLPLFVFFAMALLMPIKALDTERKIRTVMENYCGDLSLSVYMEQENENNDFDLISDVLVWLQLQGKLRAFGDNVEINRVQTPDENGDIALEVTYHEFIPFFSGVTKGIKTELSVRRRGWTGIDGKLKSSKSNNGYGEFSEEMVYVGKTMGRYHRDRNCHYISNSYQAVSVDEAKAMRDADGHRFTACETCEEFIGKSGTVYITPGGRHYHGSTDCSAMVSYVRKVPISEVLYLGACSYCGDRYD